MKYHKVRLGELDQLEKRHPLIATHKPELGRGILPRAPEDDPEFPILFYGEEDGQLACFFRSFPDTLRVDGKDIPWAWAANLMTFPDFRRRGLAQALTEQQLEEFDQSGHVWSGVFSAEAALKLYEKLSMTLVGKAPRMCFVRNVSPFLAHHMPGLAARTLGSGGKILASGLDRVRRFRQPWRKAVHAQAITPDQLQELFSDSTDTMKGVLRFDRNAPWVLRRRDVRDIDQIMLVHPADDPEPVGYFLVRQRQNLKRPIREKYYGVDSMSVMHFSLLRPHEQGHEMLLSAALNHFFASSADLFDIVTSQDDMIAAARRAGLFPLGQGMSFKYMEPTRLKGVLPDTLGSYHLTHYSGDAFAFE